MVICVFACLRSHTRFGVSRLVGNLREMRGFVLGVELEIAQGERRRTFWNWLF